MADDTFTCFISFYEEWEAPNGEGYYYAIEQNDPDPEGPFETEEAAYEAFSDFIVNIYSKSVEAFLGLK